ncbi:MAG TPA: NADH-quinone oxidoreductase subunit C [Anaerolineae bacterium]|nr:NADH-quinone oxidoreductase subunit C [Anaerolineae bacterium]
MTTEALLDTAQQLLTEWAKATTKPAAGRLDMQLEAADLPRAAAALRQARWGFLTAITGLDDIKANQLEVLYHFVNGAANVNLRVRLPRENASIPSVCDSLPGATFFERELSEMFGITVMGTPTPDRLFLSEDWPTNAPPLRKDFVMPQL